MNDRAAAFLDRFRRADRSDALLDAMADDHEGLGAAIDFAPDALLEAAETAAAAAGPPVDLHPDSFASAACDRDGRVIVADARFRDWLGGVDPLASVVRKVGLDRPNVSAIADDRTGRPVAVAAATLAVARGWPLAADVLAALVEGRAEFAVVAFRPAATAWDQAARAYGLSPQEGRLAGALARRGDLHAAAVETGVAYETARKLVGNAMRKTGAGRQTDMIRSILAAAAGDTRPADDTIRLFADLFGLSWRQAALAHAVGQGATRDEAAVIAGTSSHGAKTDLKVVFQACGVANAVDLARIAGEIDALAGLARACSVAIAPRGAVPEPLRLVARRRAPGRIAVTDHGPLKGKPLLIFHVAVGGRHQPHRLIAALQAAGWRPVTFDRPGFGLTDMVAGDPFAEGAADVLDVVEALGLARVAILARGGGTAALAAAARLGERVVGGVLVSPEPPADLDKRFTGMMGRGKALFFGNAALATAFARILSRRTSSAQIARMQRQSVAGSAIDEAVFDDAETVADIVRGSRQCALGMQGFLAEMQAHGAGARPAALADGAAWSVLHGANDPLYDFADARAFWEATLPGAAMQLVPDGGRWLHLTHAAAVVGALARVRWYAVSGAEGTR